LLPLPLPLLLLRRRALLAPPLEGLLLLPPLLP
jgi:hypothetical protein